MKALCKCYHAEYCLEREGPYMQDIFASIEQWRARGKKVALATVVHLEGSAPRRPGAKLAINEQGEFVGSVSGGCVEAAVIASALDVIKEGQPQLLTFGISAEENAAQIGLACGGSIQVFVERLEG